MFHRNPACPVPADAAQWVETSFDFLLHQFGADLMRGAVLLPDPSFFPHQYTGSDADISEIIATVAARMGADKAALQTDEAGSAVRPVAVRDVRTSRGGFYVEQHRSASAGALDDDYAQDPVTLVAVVAHQLAQQRLVGERRIDSARHDRDQLCDLATVFFGLGVFGANAALSFTHGSTAYNVNALTRLGDWSARQAGYLGEELFGFALARFAQLRGEADPPWAHALDTNPRVYMKHATKYLNAVETGGDYS
jgi:hypothetical protein